MIRMTDYNWSVVDFEGDGYQALAAVVLALAVRDWQHPHPKQAPRARTAEFFNGHWFDIMARGLGLDPEKVLDRLNDQR